MNRDFPSHEPHNVPSTSATTSGPTIKRNRTQHTCTTCRQSKLKCDRNRPCGNCIKKGKASLCTFPAPVPKKTAVSMQNRLKHLEDLVKDVMSGKVVSGSSSNESTRSTSLEKGKEVEEVGVAERSLEGQPKSSGQVVHGDTATTYVGATHWAAILEDIEEMKDYFSNEDEDMKEYTSLIFNAESPSTHMELLAAFPDRLAADRMIDQCFLMQSPALHIIHRPTFEKDYHNFWNSPPTTPLPLLSFLYSLLMSSHFPALLATHSPHTKHHTLTSIHHYRRLCISTLLLSNYTSPRPYTLETLLIYLESSFILPTSSQTQNYLLTGHIIRLSLIIGLHRDASALSPSSFSSSSAAAVTSSFSAYEAEIRRKIYQHLQTLDFLSSFHNGLPSLLSHIPSNTQPPLNILDSDFHENSPSLPPSRPETEETPILYFIAKGRLARECVKVAEIANGLSLPPYKEVVELDGLINEAYTKVPSFYKFTNYETTTLMCDSQDQIIKKLNITTIYQKTLCMLHRPYLIQKDIKGEFAYSRKIAKEAALELLKCQEIIHQCEQPGGPLSKDHWFHTSLSIHDFLLADMIIYLLLMQSLGQGKEGKRGNGVVVLGEEEERLLHTLKMSYNIWKEGGKEKGGDERKARDVVEGMLRKVYGLIGREFDINGHAPAMDLGGGEKMDVEHYMTGLNFENTADQQFSSEIYNNMQPLAPNPLLSTRTTIPFPLINEQLPLTLNQTFIQEYPYENIFVPENFDWSIFDTEFRPNLNPPPPPPIDLDFDINQDQNFLFDDFEFGL